MLTEFNVTNFRSIRNEEGISMDHFPADAGNRGPDSHVRVAAVYGHNAAGKTTLVDSMYALKRLVLESARFQNGGEMFVQPCFFENGRNDPTVFDIAFRSGRSYRYTLSVHDNSVLEETLEADGDLLFRRDSDGVAFGGSVPEEDREKIRFSYSMASPFTLLLSKCSESRIGTTQEPFEWFRTGLCFGTSGDPAVIAIDS